MLKAVHRAGTKTGFAVEMDFLPLVHGGRASERVWVTVSGGFKIF